MAVSWYAVMTEARAELLAAQRVEDVVGAGSVFLPRYRATVALRRRLVAVERPLFPRYLFANVAPGASLGPINRARGVATVVHLGDRPMPVPDQLMAAMMAAADENGLVRIPAASTDDPSAPIIRVGDEVVIRSGPFMGFRAIVGRLDKHGIASANLALFGRETPVAVPVAALEVADSVAAAPKRRRQLGRQ